MMVPSLCRDYTTAVNDAIRRTLTYFLQANATVFDDGAQDVLTGSSGRDWFFANVAGGGTLDKVTDLGAAEFANDLNFILS